jgi:hypothetical protein
MFPNIPNPDEQPLVFDYYIRVYKFLKGVKWMRVFLISVVIFIVLVLGILYTQPQRWFYHSHECDGGIGGGCNLSTGKGNFLTRW